MNWDDPAARYTLIERIGAEAYNKAFEEHIKKTTIGMNETRMQEYLRDFFLADWNAEFGAAYRISAFISSNYCVGDFPLIDG